MAEPNTIDTRTQLENALKASQTGYRNALDTMQSNAQARANAPYADYNTILQSLAPQAPEPTYDMAQERSRQNLANLGTAISAIANLGGAMGGGVAFTPSGLSDAQNKRYMALREQHDKNLNTYQQAMLRAKNEAMTMQQQMDARRKAQNAELSNIDEIAVAKAKADMDTASKNLSDYDDQQRVERQLNVQEENAKTSRMNATKQPTQSQPKQVTLYSDGKFVNVDAAQYSAVINDVYSRAVAEMQKKVESGEITERSFNNWLSNPNNSSAEAYANAHKNDNPELAAFFGNEVVAQESGDETPTPQENGESQSLKDKEDKWKNNRDN